MTLDSTLPPEVGAVDLDAVDLSDPEFWERPAAVRYTVFDALRRERPFAFFAEPASAVIEPGPGYHAVTRYADLDAISSQRALSAPARARCRSRPEPGPADLTDVRNAVAGCPTRALSLIEG